ncbi:MAG: histidinol-phosphatase [Chloroflexi bacterium AL-W]|nr:histidinol-phosphatase [Chloroflexi bacterium AL-N1]NOK71630.1 histidinol-phosphatase [Chloroflexi bacterium AL-N10]NOK78930.1 histidinol-phosphatase [Chloroflexi bacterium AL-N5]NOK86405.1 histidinol-phosphatase [Chloroflexi bacterium AL-W]
MASENLYDLRDFAAELAWQAGKLTLRYFQTAITTDFKADESPVTIADREAERLMRQMIEARYPHHSILGEEEGETRSGASHRWILDPIDGTRTFVRGVPLYAVLVGLEQEGTSVVGAVNIPAMGDFLIAAQGEGCLWNGRRAQVSQVSTLSEGLLLSTDTESMAPFNREAPYRRLVAATKMQRTWGDAYGYVLVATGRAEVMLDPAMSVWDCAALLPVVQEAGGTFTDWHGTPSIHNEEAIATNGLLHEEVLRLVAE